MSFVIKIIEWSDLIGSANIPAMVMEHEQHSRTTFFADSTNSLAYKTIIRFIYLHYFSSDKWNNQNNYASNRH